MTEAWKKFLGFAMCVFLLCAVAPTRAAAAQSVSVSSEVVSLLEQWEGFTPTYSGGYIGFGTAVSASAYPNGITREQAETLLRGTLDTFAAQISTFFSARGVTLTQQQLDALASLSYNSGMGWMNDQYRLVRTIVAGDYSANDLASALGVWCHVGSAVSPTLARHRAAEAAIFLFADYSGTGERFRYVIYDAAGGSVDTDVRFYQTGTTYVALQTAERAGSTFAGWYTADGTRVSAGVVDGYADGTFRAASAVSRAQALKLVLLAAGISPLEQPEELGWAAGYYAAAVAQGLWPEDRWEDLSLPVTRAELAELACRALVLDTSAAVSPFADTDSREAAALYDAGIFTGAQDAAGRLVFSPEDNLSRAQACAVIWRMMEWKANADALEGY